jgi:hypothetical protein
MGLPVRIIGAVISLALLAVARPARAEESDWFQPPQLRDVVLLGAAETLIAVDVLQTLDMNRHPERHFYETNPLLGLHPSNTRIIASGLVGGLAAATLWYALPSRVRWVVPLFLGIGEGAAITGNALAGMSLRF